MNKFYDKKFFSQFQSLRSVLSPTTGDIHIDLKYLKSKKIKLINLTNQKNKLKNITSTAELTIGHILNLTRNIIRIHSKFITDRKFDKNNHLVSNKELTLGIIGMGRIGKHVANRAKALGFKIIYYDPYSKFKNFKKSKSLKDLIKNSNILSIHMHYKDKYLNQFNLKTFKALKKPSYLVNTSRGEFIKENDLIDSIKNRTLSGVGLDVLKNEFKSNFKNNPKKNKLFNFFIKNKKYNIFITPKQGGSNKSAWGFTEKIIINELIKYEKKYN